MQVKINCNDFSREYDESAHLLTLFLYIGRIFDIRACAQVCEFKNDMVLCGITSVAFSGSGRILFAGYDDYNCLGWDVLGSTEKQYYQLQGHENRVSCLGVSPQGDALCTGSWDTTLKIWA